MERIEQVNPLSVSVLDLLIVSSANYPGNLYGGALRREYELSGKTFDPGPNYQRLKRLARIGLLERSPGKIPSKMGPSRRLYPLTTEGQEFLSEAGTVVERILTGTGLPRLKDDSEQQSEVIIADLTVLQVLALSEANSAGSVYGYTLQKEYGVSSGTVPRQLGRLAANGLLRGPTVVVNAIGPKRHVYNITAGGQDILEEARPVFEEILASARTIGQNNEAAGGAQ